MKKLFFMILMITMAMAKGTTQSVPKGTEAQELARISEVYANIPSLSFSMFYFYTDSLYPNTFLDSVILNCKISKGRSFNSNSEVEYLQGREFNVYVSKDDSLIVVNAAPDYKSLLKVPLLEPGFRNAHVTEMTTSDINDSTRSLHVNFRPESYYVNYTMIYDPRTGFAKSISFCTRNPYEIYGVPANHILKTTMIMTSYSTAAVDAALFNENRYIYRLNGELYLQAAWEGFTLQQ